MKRFFPLFFFKDHFKELNVQGPQFFSALHEEILLLKSIASDEGLLGTDELDLLLNEQKENYEEYKLLQRHMNVSLAAKDLATLDRLNVKMEGMLSGFTHRWVSKLSSSGLPPDLLKRIGDLQQLQQQPLLPFSQAWYSQPANSFPAHLHQAIAPEQNIVVDEHQLSTIIAYALNTSKLHSSSISVL